MCVCVTLWWTDVTNRSSYFYWTQSFFGHSGFAPVGTGNPQAERGEEAIEGGKTGTIIFFFKKRDFSGPKRTIFHPVSDVSKMWHIIFCLDVDMAWCFSCSIHRLRKTLSVHYNPILEMLLYHEYFLRGTKEKCFCAVVYDKQFLLHSTVADTPIMKIQWLGKLEEGGGDRNLTAATMK